MSKIICGVDVASASLQARIGREGAESCFSNTSDGIAELAAFCRQHQVELVAMEASGGYEKLPRLCCCDNCLWILRDLKKLPPLQAHSILLQASCEPLRYLRMEF